MTKADRKLAKAINFGLRYGMGWKGLKRYAQANYGVELKDARPRLPGGVLPCVPAWTGARRTEAVVERPVQGGPAGTHEVRTLGGRRRVLPVAKRAPTGARTRTRRTR